MTDDTFTTLIREFLTLYKVINRKAILEILNTELKNEQVIEIYQLTDGEKSSRELSGALRNKCSHATVVNLWNKWALLGLVIPAKQKGRYKAAFNLSEYGIGNVIDNKEDL
jgi:hypothetical protein